MLRLPLKVKLRQLEFLNKEARLSLSDLGSLIGSPLGVELLLRSE